MRATIDIEPVALDAIRRRPSETPVVRNGVPLLRRRPGSIVTDELIQKIREEEGN